MAEPSVQERNLLLLQRYAAGDSDAEAELVSENMGLVRNLVRRFLNRGTEPEDLIQIGTIGMLKAIRSFSLDRGTAFSTYAVPMIVGEIRRHLRDDGPVKVSRIYRAEGVALLNEKNRILSDEGRVASIEELAEHCHISPEEAAVSLGAVSPVTSLSELISEESGLTFEGSIPDAESEADRERLFNRIAISQSLLKMPPTWRKIVLLRYYRNLTQQETADRLGLTQVKISREEKKILSFLRKELA